MPENVSNKWNQNRCKDYDLLNQLISLTNLIPGFNPGDTK